MERDNYNTYLKYLVIISFLLSKNCITKSSNNKLVSIIRNYLQNEYDDVFQKYCEEKEKQDTKQTELSLAYTEADYIISDKN